MKNKERAVPQTPRKLMTYTAILIVNMSLLAACDSDIHKGDVPLQTNTVYSKQTLTIPSEKFFSVETYRICDIGGCTNSITKKTRAFQETHASITGQRIVMANIKSPLAVLGNTRLNTRLNNKINSDVLVSD